MSMISNQWKTIVLFALVLAGLPVNAIAQGYLPAFAQQTAGAQVTIVPPIDAANAYRLGTADKVRIIVFNEPTLSGEFTVSDSGGLSLPLIGEVAAAGRTPREVTQDIEQKYADGYLRSPHVSLDLLTYRPFYILGEVTKPGEYPYEAGLTVMNAVASASGFTYRANKHKVFLKRAGEAAEHEVLLTPTLQVFPGDTVRVGERYF